MSEKSIIKLVNPEFTIEYAGHEYQVRKATLDKAVQYQNKVRELKDSPNFDLEITCYCLFLVLKDKIPDLKEEDIRHNIPGNLSALEVLADLGFINPSKLGMAKEAEK